MFNQHCRCWWPGKHQGISSHSADYAPMHLPVLRGLTTPLKSCHSPFQLEGDIRMALSIGVFFRLTTDFSVHLHKFRKIAHQIRLQFGESTHYLISSPLLFIIDMNDIHTATKSFEVVLYAGDTNLISPICSFNSEHSLNQDSLDNLYASINVELDFIFEGLNVNTLSLNANRTKFMLFHYPQRKVDNLKKVDCKTNYNRYFVSYNRYLYENNSLYVTDGINKEIMPSIGITLAIQILFMV